MLPLVEIRPIEPFEELFPVENSILKQVAEDMKANGFDPGFPVVVWKRNRKAVCIDGHTRLMAAEVCGIDEVPVSAKFFKNEDEAIRYAIHCQRDRRNMTDADIARCIEAVDKLKGKGERTDLASSDARSGKSAQETAEIVGTSERKVEKYRTVMTRADDDVKAAVKSGKKSINRAYTETQQKRKGVEQEEITTDSTVLKYLKHYWNHATSKDKKAFLEWVNENQE